MDDDRPTTKSSIVDESSLLLSVELNFQLRNLEKKEKSSFGSESSYNYISEEVDFQTSELREKFGDEVNFQLRNF